MRPHNSVGGYRVYPTSPAAAEAADHAITVTSQFNEGMDRLNRERQLTEREQHLLDNLDPNSRPGNNYRRLISASNNLWTLALEKQRTRNLGIVAGPFTVNQLAHHLNRCADQWQELKRQLDE